MIDLRIQSSLILLAVVLAGCSEGSPAAPTAPSTGIRSRTAPFSLTLRVHELDRLNDAQCQIRVIAEANGGQVGSYAEWDKLQGSSFDVNTREYIGVTRTQQLFPDVFTDGQIRPGETQQGIVDLDLYRREAGVAVLVEFEFHYWVAEDATSGANVKRMAKISHQCQ